MAEYSSAQRLVQRLVLKKGRAGVQIYTVGKGTVSDPARPWKRDGGAAADALVATVPAVFLSPNEARGDSGQFAFPVFARGRADLSDSVAPDATHAAYLSPLDLPDGVEIKAGMLVVSKGSRYVVLRNQPYSPGGDDVLHILSLKG
jgi:hypothetical protein